MKFKRFFKLVCEWLEEAFLSIKKFMKEYAGPAIDIMNEVKQFVDNPALDVLVLLTPNPIDNKALLIARECLLRAIEALKLQQQCAQGTDAERLQCYINWLRDLPLEQRKAMYLRTASIIARLASGEKIPAHKVDSLVQLAYSESKLEKGTTV